MKKTPLATATTATGTTAMTDDDLIARLRKADEYEPLGHDGWEAADRIEALVKALRLLHDNVVLAFPALADLGPVANARAALKGADHE